jgi:hypothetical protein
MKTPITAEYIAAARKAGACSEALQWLEAAPRTIEELAALKNDWLSWALKNLPAELTKLPAGLTSTGDLYLGSYAHPLPPGLKHGIIYK